MWVTQFKLFCTGCQKSLQMNYDYIKNYIIIFYNQPKLFLTFKYLHIFHFKSMCTLTHHCQNYKLNNYLASLLAISKAEKLIYPMILTQKSINAHQKHT